MVPREEGLTQETKQVHPGVRELLEEFKHLFHEPHGLPPRRMHNHAIRLADGASHSNLRPYRYSYYQKNEIEKIVKEMLDAKIICPSVSLFSSSVILVRKRATDGGFVWIIEL